MVIAGFHLLATCQEVRRRSSLPRHSGGAGEPAAVQLGEAAATGDQVVLRLHPPALTIRRDRKKGARTAAWAGYDRIDPVMNQPRHASRSALIVPLSRQH